MTSRTCFVNPLWRGRKEMGCWSRSTERAGFVSFFSPTFFSTIFFEKFSTFGIQSTKPIKAWPHSMQGWHFCYYLCNNDANHCNDAETANESHRLVAVNKPSMLSMWLRSIRSIEEFESVQYFKRLNASSTAEWPECHATTPSFKGACTCYYSF